VEWLARGEHEVPADDAWLGPVEAAWASRMSFTKRWSEFRLNRWTGKHAVAQHLGLGTDRGALGRVEIRNHLDGQRRGAPYVVLDGASADVEVSLTDRAGWAVCLVGRGLGVLGVDLEVVEPRSDGFVRDFLTPAERALVESRPEGEARWLAANLVWSAKESALKVLRTGLRRDTWTVEVTVPDPDAPPGSWSPLAVRGLDDEQFAGWWVRHGAFVLTVVARGAPPCPTSLEDPPALTGGRPSHAWLSAPRR
jgi:4'-phosphopantetheinyl transferase